MSRKFKFTVQEMRKISHMYDRYNYITDESDLKKNKLSLSDYAALEDVLKDLSKWKISKTFISSVAKWCDKHGCSVVLADGLNYIITL